MGLKHTGLPYPQAAWAEEYASHSLKRESLQGYHHTCKCMFGCLAGSAVEVQIVTAPILSRQDTVSRSAHNLNPDLGLELEMEVERDPDLEMDLDLKLLTLTGIPTYDKGMAQTGGYSSCRKVSPSRCSSRCEMAAPLPARARASTTAFPAARCFCKLCVGALLPHDHRLIS